MMNSLNPSEKIISGLVLHCSSHFYFVPEINLHFKKPPLICFLKLKLQKHIFDMK